MRTEACTRCQAQVAHRHNLTFGQCIHRLCEPCASFIEAALMGRPVWARGAEDTDHEAPIRNIEQFDRFMVAWYNAEGSIDSQLRAGFACVEHARKVRDRFIEELASWKLLSASLASSWKGAQARTGGKP